MVDSKWETVVKQLTGFDGGTRAHVGGVGGTDPAAGDGAEWMVIGIDWTSELIEAVAPATPQDAPARSINFYKSFAGAGSHPRMSYYTVTLGLPGSSGNGADWSETGNAAAFSTGYGDVLKRLETTYTTSGYQFTSARAVAEADAVDLRTFAELAAAFDRVTQYFRTQSPKLEQWVKELGAENAAYQGTGADVFRDLVDGLSIGYKGFLQLISPVGTTTSLAVPGYTSGSTVSDKLLEGEKAIHTAAVSLAAAWTTWTSTPAWQPTHHLDLLLDELTTWINANNISQVWWDKGEWHRSAAFSYDSPYGDIREKAAWQELSRKAYQQWLATVTATLDPAANAAMLDLNKALMAAFGSVPTFPFRPGVSSLREANAVDEAARQKAELEREQREAKAEAEKQKEEMEKQKEELEKKAGEVKGDGAGGAPPPPLPPNTVGGGLGPGNGPGTGTGGKPPPLPKPNQPGGPGTVVRNPDGSVSVRNPDGSVTTTYPDGRKETVPAGALPPPLNPNLPGGWPGNGGPGTPVTPVRTVKGPDGNTTSYNSDGSRTTTHKDGTSTTVRPDGTSTTVNPDGTRTVLNKDGSETLTYRDGTKATIRPDGSTLTQYPDGSSVRRAPDGTLTTTDPQGRSTVTHPQPGATVQNPNGSTTVYGKDGTTTTTFPDGTRTTITANGSVTTVDPDGTKTVSQLGKATTTVHYADGAVAQVGPDGTVSTTYKDGSTTRLGPDGTYTTTDAQGNRTTEHLNTRGGTGPQTIHHPDGSTTTKYPDGTVDKQLKGGGHQITYPDGRTVTTDAYGRTIGTGSGPGTGPGTGLGQNPKSAGSWGNYDYYDYPDDRKRTPTPLSGGGSGSGGGPAPLPPNPVGAQSLTSSGTPAGAGPGGERTRSTAMAEAAAVRGRAGQLAQVEALAASRPHTSSSGGMPMGGMPMGGMGGMGGAGNQSDERERSTWVSEDEDTWGTDEGGVSAVIGR